jgi:uncharacterized iron-regulated membrane protein
LEINPKIKDICYFIPSMKKTIYQLHIFLGLVVSIPVLAWALSGLMYAMPNVVEGGSVERLTAERIKIAPSDAMARANALAGRELPTTALTLLMREGRPQYQSIGGMGADSIFIDAETGLATMSPPPSLKTRFFREAHFYFFAGSWQTPTLILFSALAAISALTGIYLNAVYWLPRFRSRKNTTLDQVN